MKKEMYKPIFGTRLAEARHEAGLSQRKAAEKLNVSKSTVASWETGRTEPSIEMLGRLGKLYCVSIDSLIGLPEE